MIPSGFLERSSAGTFGYMAARFCGDSFFSPVSGMRPSPMLISEKGFPSHTTLQKLLNIAQAATAAHNARICFASASGNVLLVIKYRTGASQRPVNPRKL